MRRYVYRRPFDFGQRLRLSVVLVDVVTGAAPGGLSIPIAMHHYMKNIKAG